MAGERAEAVSNEVETRMLELAYSRPVDMIMYTQVNIWLTINYMHKFPKMFKVIFPVLDAASNIALAGLGLKIYINLIELKQGLYRIIDYDVEIKNKEESSKGKKVK